MTLLSWELMRIVTISLQFESSARGKIHDFQINNYSSMKMKIYENDVNPTIKYDAILDTPTAEVACIFYILQKLNKLVIITITKE